MALYYNFALIRREYWKIYFLRVFLFQYDKRNTAYFYEIAQYLVHSSYFLYIQSHRIWTIIGLKAKKRKTTLDGRILFNIPVGLNSLTRFNLNNHLFIMPHYYSLHASGYWKLFFNLFSISVRCTNSKFRGLNIPLVA